jgi:hypothetical protein
VHLGRVDEARALIANWLEPHPGDTIGAEALRPPKEPYKTSWLDDLRRAGLPER